MRNTPSASQKRIKTRRITRWSINWCRLRPGRLKSRAEFHSLSHTHTSLLAEAKVGLEEIMDRLGHCDHDTTKNVYLHVTKEMKKETSHKFAQLMRNL
nr:tyrosine-type recombinase/integrase [Pseudoneobacillus rhizosphaerae]